MASIYVIKNKINNKVYIGQTIQPINVRFTNHKIASRQEDTKFYRAMRKYGEENFYIELLEIVSIQKLNEREKYWIKYYDSYNNGYNSTLGGDGLVRLDYDYIYQEWLKGKSASQISNDNNIGRDTVSRILRNEFNITSNEIIARANDAKRALDNDFILSKWNEGLTPGQISKIYGSQIKFIKQVLYKNGITEVEIKKRCNENQRILTENQTVQLWEEGLTITDIQRKYGGNSKTIHDVLINNGITSEDINNRRRIVCNQNAKSVVQLSLDEKYINTFPSCKKAGESLGKPSTSINSCCNHKPKYKTAYGFKWMFEDEYNSMKEGSKNGTQ